MAAVPVATTAYVPKIRSTAGASTKEVAISNYHTFIESETRRHADRIARAVKDSLINQRDDAPPPSALYYAAGVLAPATGTPGTVSQINGRQWIVLPVQTEKGVSELPTTYSPRVDIRGVTKGPYLTQQDTERREDGAYSPGTKGHWGHRQHFVVGISVHMERSLSSSYLFYTFRSGGDSRFGGVAPYLYNREGDHTFGFTSNATGSAIFRLEEYHIETKQALNGSSLSKDGFPVPSTIIWPPRVASWQIGWYIEYIDSYTLEWSPASIVNIQYLSDDKKTWIILSPSDRETDLHDKVVQYEVSTAAAMQQGTVIVDSNHIAPLGTNYVSVNDRVRVDRASRYADEDKKRTSSGGGFLPAVKGKQPREEEKKYVIITQLPRRGLQDTSMRTARGLIREEDVGGGRRVVEYDNHIRAVFSSKSLMDLAGAPLQDPEQSKRVTVERHKEYDVSQDIAQLVVGEPWDIMIKDPYDNDRSHWYRARVARQVPGVTGAPSYRFTIDAKSGEEIDKVDGMAKINTYTVGDVTILRRLSLFPFDKPSATLSRFSVEGAIPFRDDSKKNGTLVVDVKRGDKWTRGIITATNGNEYYVDIVDLAVGAISVPFADLRTVGTETSAWNRDAPPPLAPSSSSPPRSLPPPDPLDIGVPNQEFKHLEQVDYVYDKKVRKGTIMAVPAGGGRYYSVALADPPTRGGIPLLPKQIAKIGTYTVPFSVINETARTSKANAESKNPKPWTESSVWNKLDAVDVSIEGSKLLHGVVSFVDLNVTGKTPLERIYFVDIYEPRGAIRVTGAQLRPLGFTVRAATPVATRDEIKVASTATGPTKRATTAPKPSSGKWHDLVPQPDDEDEGKVESKGSLPSRTTELVPLDLSLPIGDSSIVHHAESKVEFILDDRIVWGEIKTAPEAGDPRRTHKVIMLSDRTVHDVPANKIFGSKFGTRIFTVASLETKVGEREVKLAQKSLEGKDIQRTHDRSKHLWKPKDTVDIFRQTGPIPRGVVTTVKTTDPIPGQYQNVVYIVDVLNPRGAIAVAGSDLYPLGSFSENDDAGSAAPLFVPPPAKKVDTPPPPPTPSGTPAVEPKPTKKKTIKLGDVPPSVALPSPLAKAAAPAKTATAPPPLPAKAASTPPIATATEIPTATASPPVVAPISDYKPLLIASNKPPAPAAPTGPAATTETKTTTTTRAMRVLFFKKGDSVMIPSDYMSPVKRHTIIMGVLPSVGSSGVYNILTPKEDVLSEQDADTVTSPPFTVTGLLPSPPQVDGKWFDLNLVGFRYPAVVVAENHDGSYDVAYRQTSSGLYVVVPNRKVGVDLFDLKDGQWKPLDSNGGRIIFDGSPTSEVKVQTHHDDDVMEVDYKESAFSEFPNKGWVHTRFKVSEFQAKIREWETSIESENEAKAEAIRLERVEAKRKETLALRRAENLEREARVAALQAELERKASSAATSSSATESKAATPAVQVPVATIAPQTAPPPSTAAPSPTTAAPSPPIGESKAPAVAAPPPVQWWYEGATGEVRLGNVLYALKRRAGNNIEMTQNTASGLMGMHIPALPSNGGVAVAGAPRIWRVLFPLDFPKGFAKIYISSPGAVTRQLTIPFISDEPSGMADSREAEKFVNKLVATATGVTAPIPPVIAPTVPQETKHPAAIGPAAAGPIDQTHPASLLPAAPSEGKRESAPVVAAVPIPTAAPVPPPVVPAKTTPVFDTAAADLAASHEATVVAREEARRREAAMQPGVAPPVPPTGRETKRTTPVPKYKKDQLVEWTDGLRVQKGLIAEIDDTKNDNVVQYFITTNTTPVWIKEDSLTLVVVPLPPPATPPAGSSTPPPPAKTAPQLQPPTGNVIRSNQIEQDTPALRRASEQPKRTEQPKRDLGVAPAPSGPVASLVDIVTATNAAPTPNVEPTAQPPPTPVDPQRPIQLFGGQRRVMFSASTVRREEKKEGKEEERPQAAASSSPYAGFPNAFAPGAPPPSPPVWQTAAQPPAPAGPVGTPFIGSTDIKREGPPGDGGGGSPPSPDVIYFDDTDGTPEQYRFLSNFYPNSSFNVDGITWTSAEHYFQVVRFGPFSPQSPPFQSLIADASTPRRARMLGEQAVNTGTVGIRQDLTQIAVMEKAIMLKFSLIPTLTAFLLSTSPRTIAYRDTNTFWGIGDGSGQNQMGRILMKVRDFLSGRYATPTPVVGAPTAAPAPSGPAPSGPAPTAAIAPPPTGLAAFFPNPTPPQTLQDVRPLPLSLFNYGQMTQPQDNTFGTLLSLGRTTEFRKDYPPQSDYNLLKVLDMMSIVGSGSRYGSQIAADILNAKFRIYWKGTYGKAENIQLGTNYRGELQGWLSAAYNSFGLPLRRGGAGTQGRALTMEKKKSSDVPDYLAPISSPVDRSHLVIRLPSLDYLRYYGIHPLATPPPVPNFEALRCVAMTALYIQCMYDAQLNGREPPVSVDGEKVIRMLIRSDADRADVPSDETLLTELKQGRFVAGLRYMAKFAALSLESMQPALATVEGDEGEISQYEAIVVIQSTLVSTLAYRVYQDYLTFNKPTEERESYDFIANAYLNAAGLLKYLLYTPCPLWFVTGAYQFCVSISNVLKEKLLESDKDLSSRTMERALGGRYPVVCAFSIRDEMFARKFGLDKLSVVALRNAALAVPTGTNAEETKIAMALGAAAIFADTMITTTVLMNSRIVDLLPVTDFSTVPL